MPRPPKQLIIALALIAAILVVLVLAGPYAQRSFFYPKARGLPAVVGETAEQLLTRLQAVLETNVPPVAKTLLPGLSTARISELETQGGFRLSDDLRAFYRWRNGMPTNSATGLLPGQRFVPLDEVVQELTLARQQLDSASASQRAALSVFAGHRKGWVTVLDDGAGDGYFYDPKRTDVEGAFFYHMAEVRYYVWFPSFRNFLAGAIECYESCAIKLATNGTDLDENLEHTERIWSRFSKSNDN